MSARHQEENTYCHYNDVDYEEESFYSIDEGLSTIVEESSIDLRSLSTISLLRRKRGLTPPTRRRSIDFDQLLIDDDGVDVPGQQQSPTTPVSSNVKIHVDYEILLQRDEKGESSNLHDSFVSNMTTRRIQPMPLSDDEFTFETCSTNYDLESDLEDDDEETIDDDLSLSEIPIARGNPLKKQDISKFDVSFLQCRVHYQELSLIHI